MLPSMSSASHLAEPRAGTLSAPGNLCTVFLGSCVVCYQEPVVSAPKPDYTGYRCYRNYTVYLKITSTYEI